MTKFTVDTSKGFDCMRYLKKGTAKVVEHFATYAEAKAYADTHKNITVRYFAETEKEEGEAE